MFRHHHILFPFWIRTLDLAILPLLLTGCNKHPKEEQSAPSVVSSQWHFNSAPSCVDLTNDSNTIVVGTEDGQLYILRDERVRRIMIQRGDRILKTEYLGNTSGLEYYLVSIRYNGLHIVGIDKNDSVGLDIPVEMNDRWKPHKGYRYTVFDWIRQGKNVFLVATSNGIWELALPDGLPDNNSPVMRRVGRLGINKSQYAISAMALFKRKIYFAAQDGLFRLEGEEARKVVDEPAKFDHLTAYEDSLVVLNGKFRIVVDANGEARIDDNEKYHVRYEIRVNENTLFGFTDNSLLVNNKQRYEFPLTRYAENAFAVKRVHGRPVGIYTINGNNLVYIDVSLSSVNDPVTVQGLCEDVPYQSAYCIDKHWNLFHITADDTRFVAHIEGMRTAISDMIVKDGDIYAVSVFSLFRIPTSCPFYSNTVNAEKIDLFQNRKEVDSQNERMVRLYGRDTQNDIILATRAHLWTFDITKGLSQENPSQLKIKAVLNDSLKVQDLDQAFEMCDALCITKFPDKNISDIFVGTRHHGILSFAPNMINTLVPETRMGLARTIDNVKAIDNIKSETDQSVKILVVGNDSLHVVTFRADNREVASEAYAAKNAVFVSPDTIFAISETGGYAYFNVRNDSLVKTGDYYPHMHYYPQVARLRDQLLINSVVGPYLVDNRSHQTQMLLLKSRKTDFWFYVILSIIGLLSLVAFYLSNIMLLRFNRFSRIWEDLETTREEHLGLSSGLTASQVVVGLIINRSKEVMISEMTRRSYKMQKLLSSVEDISEHQFDDRIASVLRQMKYFSYNFDDEYYQLSAAVKEQKELKQRETTIKTVYASLPDDKKIETESLSDITDSIVAALKEIYMTSRWLSFASNTLYFMVENEQKIGKANQKLWQQIMDRKLDGKSLFDEKTKEEMKKSLAMHPLCDYSALIFEGIDLQRPTGNLFAGYSENPENYQEAHVIAHAQDIMECFHSYYKNQGGEDMRKAFIELKRPIETALGNAYLRIIAKSHTSESNRMMLIDYFKNLLTYLYYHLFVADSHHLLDYNDKEHKYESYYDFQQQIVVLSAVLNNGDGNEKFNMRPTTLLDKLYLRIEGNNSCENSISKFKDKTKTLHLAFYKRSEWQEYPAYVQMLFQVFPALDRLYGVKPNKLK